MDISSLGQIGNGLSLDSLAGGGISPLPQDPFYRIMKDYLDQARKEHEAGNRAVLDLAAGRTEEIHQVMLAVTKADMTFRTILAVRNKVTDAYQEISRMSV